MLADLRLALRLLRRQPAFAAVVVLTLGLGVGAVAAVFTLADPMIVRSLPYVDADRIVEVRAAVKETTTRVHADDFVAIAANARTLDAVSTLNGPYVGRFRDLADPLLGGGVSGNFLRLTGLVPPLGRTFRPDEYQRSESVPPVVTMLTWGFWQTAFGGATDVIGSRLELTGPPALSMEIVGVLPREFFYPEPINRPPVFIVPGALDPSYLGKRNVYPTVLARLRPEYTAAQAEAEITTILAGVERANPTFEQGRAARLFRLQDLLFRGVRTPLLLLFVATGCLLMLAWVNLSHLMQARNRARERDVAVSLALGAGRWRVVRQMTIETTLLTLLGSAAGLLIGSLLFSWGMAQTPEYSHIYRLIPSGLDARVVAFTIGLAVLGMMAIGIWPAWRASGRDVRASLVAAPDRRRGWRIGGEALAIAGQSAFAVGLVVTCLLVVRSFIGLVTAERGFDPARVQLAGVEVPRDEPRARTQLYRRLIEELGRVPGVEAAATANGIPALTLPEAPMDENGKPIANVIAYQTSGKLAAAMDMRLEEGRLFDDNESFATAPVAVVDRSAADLMWPGQPALGRIVRLRGGRAAEVVGVIARVRPLTGDSIRGTVLTSIDVASPAVSNRLTVALRFDDRQSPAAADLAAAARRADPRIVWRGTAGMSSWERTIGQPRFLASALGILAALTALMAGFGVLGVVSHVVSRRTREIGIRMALGADRAGVRLLIVRQALTPAAIGVTMGLVLAFWWSSSVRSVLIGIGPHDPWSFVIAAIATLLTVAAASVRPAMRASGIDPSRALRME